MNFEWDIHKAMVNERKHAVSFDEAESVFRDPQMRLKYDNRHSDEEDRYLAIGFSAMGRLLTMIHAYRGETIRLIGARRSDAIEEKHYAQKHP